jgi:electron transfer flavoprotein-quinone oxidoreductase
LRAGDTTTRGLSAYRRRLDQNFVLRDHERLRRAPHLVLSERVQQQYPAMICDLVEDLFTVTNPTPKQGALRLMRRNAKKQRVRLRHLLADGWEGLRTFG